MSAPLLEARGLAARRGGREVLRGVDLDLRPGEVVAVLGPNGAGKSTLLAALAGLLPAAAGTVERRARVATALQDGALADRSALANVEAALRWWGVPRAARRARAEHALGALGAAHLAPRRAIELSGGEARRVHLARALALEAGVLLLDEPFAGLDAPARADLLEDAGAALAHPERAVAVILHDRAEAWALADRVVVLLGGRPVAAGPVRTVLERPPSAEVAAFLGFTGRLELPRTAACACCARRTPRSTRRATSRPPWCGGSRWRRASGSSSRSRAAGSTRRRRWTRRRRATWSASGWTAA